MPSASLHIFISYSRTNAAFVDRLEADLKARNFHTWVDRLKLEGGQNWMDEIEKAINECHVLVLAVSPEAVASDWVRMEYRHAMRQGKPIIPAYCVPTVQVPMDISGLEWIDFHTDHDQGLRDLLIALSRAQIPAATIPNPTISIAMTAQLTTTPPQLVPPKPAPPPPPPDLRALYDAGMAAWTKGDVEQAAVFWQQLLDRDPHYQGGTLEPQMKRLRADLHNTRLKRYRQLASEAHSARQWGQEIGALQGLLSLEPRNREAGAALLQALRAYAEAAYAEGAWADEISRWQTLLVELPKNFQVEERIAIAEHNQQHAWKYDYAEELVKRQDFDTAKTQLAHLYMDAPYYGDPKGLAAGLGLPPLKDIWKGIAEKERRSKFWTPPFTIWVYALLLLSGVGAIVALSTQSLAWTIGTEIIVLLLAYWLGYRKFLNGRIYISIALISCVIVAGLVWLASTINYQQSVPDPNYDAYHWLFDSSSSKLLLGEEMFNWLGSGLCFSLMFGSLVALPNRKRGISSETIKSLRTRRKFRDTLKNILYGGLIAVVIALELLIFIGGVGWASTINSEGASFTLFSTLGLFVGLVAGWGVGASPVVWIKAKGLFSRKRLLETTSPSQSATS